MSATVIPRTPAELAALIREGCTIRPKQAFGRYYRAGAACALGAAYLAAGGRPTTRSIRRWLTLVLLVAWVDHVAELRLGRWLPWAMSAAVVLLWLRPSLWPWLYGLGLLACLAVIASHLAAGVAAEVARWRETRR